MLHELIQWINGTSLSHTIAETNWIIPAVQTIHILAISVVVSTMGMLDLRLMGLSGMRHSIPQLSSRYLPWMWGAVVLLLLTGVILIIGEPDRSLGNSVFQAKMALLATVLLLTIAFDRILRGRVARLDDVAVHPLAAKFVGSVSLAMWIGIVVAGRWIAYS